MSREFGRGADGTPGSNGGRCRLGGGPNGAITAECLAPYVGDICARHAPCPAPLQREMNHCSVCHWCPRDADRGPVGRRGTVIKRGCAPRTGPIQSAALRCMQYLHSPSRSVKYCCEWTGRPQRGRWTHLGIVTRRRVSPNSTEVTRPEKNPIRRSRMNTL